MMGYFIRGKIPRESHNPVNNLLIWVYRPLLRMVLAAPRTMLLLSLLSLLSLLAVLSLVIPLRGVTGLMEPLKWPVQLIHPVAPAFSEEALARIDGVQEWVTQAWREGFQGTPWLARWGSGLGSEFMPELFEGDLMYMPTTLPSLSIGKARELLQQPGTASAYSERVAGGRYIEILPKRLEAARLGLNIEDINQIVSVAVGGINITQTVEGLERYPVNLRFPREQRDDIHKLRQLPLVTASGAQIPLSQVAEVKVVDGPPMLKSENGRLNGWTFVDIRGVDLGGYVGQAQRLVQEQVELPPGYSITWSGQYEYMLRAQQRLAKLIPLTLCIIFVLLYLALRSAGAAVLVMLTLPFALVGGFWLVLLLDYNLSVAVAVGFIALVGVAAEFGVVMLIYLDNALARRKQQGQLINGKDLKDAIIEGAVLRVRPKAMTVGVIIAGLLPIMLSEGTGSEVMQRIVAPMVGGMITAPLLSLFVIPAVYLLWKQRDLAKQDLQDRYV